MKDNFEQLYDLLLYVSEETKLESIRVKSLEPHESHVIPVKKNTILKNDYTLEIFNIAVEKSIAIKNLRENHALFKHSLIYSISKCKDESEREILSLLLELFEKCKECNKD